MERDEEFHDRVAASMEYRLKEGILSPEEVVLYLRLGTLRQQLDE